MEYKIKGTITDSDDNIIEFTEKDVSKLVLENGWNIDYVKSTNLLGNIYHIIFEWRTNSKTSVKSCEEISKIFDGYLQKSKG